MGGKVKKVQGLNWVFEKTYQQWVHQVPGIKNSRKDLKNLRIVNFWKIIGFPKRRARKNYSKTRGLNWN